MSTNNYIFCCYYPEDYIIFEGRVPENLQGIDHENIMAMARYSAHDEDWLFCACGEDGDWDKPCTWYSEAGEPFDAEEGKRLDEALWRLQALGAGEAHPSFGEDDMEDRRNDLQSLLEGFFEDTSLRDDLLAEIDAYKQVASQFEDFLALLPDSF